MGLEPLPDAIEIVVALLLHSGALMLLSVAGCVWPIESGAETERFSYSRFTRIM